MKLSGPYPTETLRGPFNGTQMESAMRCQACAGQGGNEVVRCYQPGCTEADSRQGCSHARWEWERCAECDGTGSERAR
jgi:hypothetical protein